MCRILCQLRNSGASAGCEAGRGKVREGRKMFYILPRKAYVSSEVGNCSDITGRQSPAKPQNLAEILRNYRVGLPCPRGHCVKRPVCQQDRPWGTLICSFRLWEKSVWGVAPVTLHQEAQPGSAIIDSRPCVCAQLSLTLQPHGL